MKLGTKVLLVTLAITIGLSAILAWVVTLNITLYETARADQRITQGIARYNAWVDQRHREIDQVVRLLLEAPHMRSLLQVADDNSDPEARNRAVEQLKHQVIGLDVGEELRSHDLHPAFHVLVNQSGAVLMASAGSNAALSDFLSGSKVAWPAEQVLNSPQRVSCYISTPAGLFLALGVPLRAQMGEPPSHACFVAFRVDDAWMQRQLGDQPIGSRDTALFAWVVVNNRVVARAASGAGPSLLNAFDGTISRSNGIDRIEFPLAGQTFIGQSSDLKLPGNVTGRLILASSLDEALAPLHRLQKQILLIVIAACGIAYVACRIIARWIARPIQSLVAGTQRIAAGQFETPVEIQRRDEIGLLADSFNQMSRGLVERDKLREERTKTKRDLALARKIQMDVLPKTIPACPGYDIAAFSRPAEQTGGDIYDILPVQSDSLLLLLADATGHGIGPALSVTQVRSMLRIGVRLGADIEQSMNHINAQLCQDLGSERFVTAFLGILDPVTHELTYHSAGQGPLLHYHAEDDRCEWLGASMLPLGVSEELLGDGVQRMRLEPGDCVVLLTDGFYEYHDPASEQFGQERVGAIVRQFVNENTDALIKHLVDAVIQFSRGSPQLDDMTAVILRRIKVR